MYSFIYMGGCLILYFKWGNLAQHGFLLIKKRKGDVIKVKEVIQMKN